MQRIKGWCWRKLFKLRFAVEPPYQVYWQRRALSAERKLKALRQ